MAAQADESRPTAPARRPVPAVVVASPVRGISFGGFLPLDGKEFPGAAAHDSSNGSGLVGTSQAIITT